MILTFEDSEEEILNHIISYVGIGARAFQVAEIAKTNLNFNGLEIDITNRLVRKQRQEIDLTFIEFEVLYLLANNPGRVFSKEQIYDVVWKESYSGDYNIVMSHIHNIRGKMGSVINRRSDRRRLLEKGKTQLLYMPFVGKKKHYLGSRKLL